MIILENACVTIVEDLPSNYESPEWQVYEEACDEADSLGLNWTEKQAVTWAAYRAALSL